MPTRPKLQFFKLKQQTFDGNIKNNILKKKENSIELLRAVDPLFDLDSRL